MSKVKCRKIGRKSYNRSGKIRSGLGEKLSNQIEGDREGGKQGAGKKVSGR